MKICKRCVCVNEDEACRCKKCNASLEKCRQIPKEEVLAEVKLKLKKKRIRRWTFAVISLFLYIAVFVVAAIFCDPEEAKRIDDLRTRIMIVAGWILSPVCFAVWFLSLLIPKKLYKLSQKYENIFSELDQFFLWYDENPKPELAYTLRYKIWVTSSYVFAFAIPLFYLCVLR